MKQIPTSFPKSNRIEDVGYNIMWFFSEQWVQISWKKKLLPRFISTLSYFCDQGWKRGRCYICLYRIQCGNGKLVLGRRLMNSCPSYLWQKNMIELISTCFYYIHVLWSYCTVLFPQDINGKLFVPKFALSQDVCTYGDFIYRTVEIPGCPHHVAPYFSYPVAVSCKCGRCNTDYSDCTHETIKTNYCIKPQKSYLMGLSVWF